MHYQEFVSRVSESIRAEHPGEAEYAIQTTLFTLGEHLGGTEAEALAARLPAELQPQLSSGNYAAAAKNFAPEEFYRRVAARMGESSTSNGGGRTEASVSADAVLEALSEAVGGTEAAEISNQPSLETVPLPNT